MVPDYVQHNSRNGVCDIPKSVLNATAGLESSTFTMLLMNITRQNFNILSYVPWKNSAFDKGVLKSIVHGNYGDVMNAMDEAG